MIRKILPWLMLFLLLIVFIGGCWATSSQQLTLIFMDVGQGDASLIRTPAGQNILIDGGPDRTILSKLERYLPWTERTIDLVVLSHPHADHLAGLNYVLERYRVRQVLITEAVHTTPEYLRFLELIQQKKIPIVIALQGQEILFDNDIKLEVIWPNRSFANQKLSNLNDSSIVIRLLYGTSSALFTGDTPLENEADILEAGINVSAQVLKVAHQGSKTSSGDDFLRAVGAESAVISVGPNRYGHPHAEVLARLRVLIPQVLRTDEAGDIIFISYGQNFKRQSLKWWQFWFSS